MRLVTVERGFSSIIGLALILGCAGVGAISAPTFATITSGQSQPARQVQSSASAAKPSSGFANADARSTGAIIVGARNGVYVYSTTLSLVAEISGISFPYGLALDASGNLYIANGGSGGIPVYKNDYKTLVAILADPYPSLGVAVDKSGVVAAMNIDSKPTSVGSVTFFASGSSTPCVNLTFPNLLGVFQGAFDDAGNLYVTGETLSSSQVVGVIRGGCSATGITLLSTGNTFRTNIFGIQVTRFGKIAVEDQINRVADTYNPPVNDALGMPISTTALPDNTPYQFGYTERGAFIFVADSSTDQVYKYVYPVGGHALQVFGAKQLERPIGLVITPAAQL
jgi:hypothetical protein